MEKSNYVFVITDVSKWMLACKAVVQYVHLMITGLCESLNSVMSWDIFVAVLVSDMVDIA